VFALGRNHPAMREALKGVLDAELPNLVQLDLSALAGVLAERLLHRIPDLEKVFFTNSGTETVEAALKFARAATGRPGIVYCSHAFHGLSYGALCRIASKCHSMTSMPCSGHSHLGEWLGSLWSPSRARE